MKPADILARYSALKAQRTTHEQVWQDIAEHIRPMRAEFKAEKPIKGAKRTDRIYDSTPILSADNFAAGIYGMMTNPANQWFRLRAADDDLNADDETKLWLDVCADRTLESFGPGVSAFYNQAPAFFLDLAAFGTSVFYNEEVPGSGRILDACRPLSECVIGESAWGDVDTVIRKFSMSARQLVQEFGEDKVSASVLSQARSFTNQDFMVDCLHYVAPNPDYDPDAKGLRGKPVRSIYLEHASQNILSDAGYWESPFQVARWSQAAGEVYGRGIGEMTLPDAKMLHRMNEVAIRSAQKVADPPLAASDEGAIRAARTYPGGITYGAIDAQGNLMLRPLYTGGNPGISLDMIERFRASIRDAFYFSLMQMVQTPTMTATEWVGRQEEKLRLMGPHLGRIQSEFLSPLITRRFGMLLRANQLPPPPPSLRGANIVVEYVSPLALAQKSAEGQSIIRLLQSAAPVIQMQPDVIDNLDGDATLRSLADAYGVPAKIMRGQKAVEQTRGERAQQMQMQQAMAAAQQGADIAATAGKAAQAGLEIPV